MKTAAAVLMLGVLVTGCSFSVSFNGLDIEALETEVDRGIEEQTGVGIAEVVCPDEVDPAAGATFICTARADDGTSLVVTVTQSDDQGNVTWEITGSTGGPAAGIDIEALRAEIASGIEEQTGVAILQVVCPEDVTPEAGGTFTCSADAEDGTALVITVTQEDDAGNVTWEVTGTS